MNFRNISVEPLQGIYNSFGYLQERRCDAEDRYERHDGISGFRYVRCGAEALYVVTRTSELTDNVYSDVMCERHASPWREGVQA